MALVIGVAVVAILAGAHPAGACSIALPVPTDEELLTRADLVFEGIAVAREEPTTTSTVFSSADPVTWTFSVERVVKGAASASQQVVTARSEASCGFTFAVGHRYRVYAEEGPTGFTTGLFSGTREITAEATTTTTPTTPPDPPSAPTTLGGQQLLARTGLPVGEAISVAGGLLVAGWLLARVRRA